MEPEENSFDVHSRVSDGRPRPPGKSIAMSETSSTGFGHTPPESKLRKYSSELLEERLQIEILLASHIGSKLRKNSSEILEERLQFERLLASHIGSKLSEEEAMQVVTPLKLGSIYDENLELPKSYKASHLAYDGSILGTGEWSKNPKHGSENAICASRKQVIPERFCSDQIRFQNSTSASTSDIGRPPSFASISPAPSSVAAPDMAFGWSFNCQETSNRADIRIDMPDENDIQRGKTRMAYVCSLETDSTVAASSSCSKFTCDLEHQIHAGAHLNQQKTSQRAEVPHASIVIPKDAMPNDYPHDHQALPVMANVRADETKSLTKTNYIIIGITGQAAVSLVSSSSSDSPILHFFVAATATGFLGCFLANYVLKKPKIARILSKIGVIGAAWAVIIALGMRFPKDTKWHMNIAVTVALCVISAVMVASS